MLPHQLSPVVVEVVSVGLRRFRVNANVAGMHHGEHVAIDPDLPEWRRFLRYLAPLDVPTAQIDNVGDSDTVTTDDGTQVVAA